MLLHLHLLVLACLLAFVSSKSYHGGPRKPKKEPEVLTVVLITGCSSGIGKSIALEFAKHPNFKVWATMRSTDKWDVEPQHNLIIAPMDVTSDESVDTLVARIIMEEGKIDIVVNNAGYGLAACLELATIEEAKNVFDVNVWGTVRVMQAVLPHMRRQKNGHLISISSTSGIRGVPCLEYYTGSKFALEGITDSMRYTYGQFNISMTNINAGPVKTSFIDRFGQAEVGGKGTRAIDSGPGEYGGQYLVWLNDRSIKSLERRINAPGAQTSEEVALVVVKIAFMKMKTHRITDVPFNIGTNVDSQTLLEGVKVNPTGWGGIYSTIMKSLPKFQEPQEKGPKDEL